MISVPSETWGVHLSLAQIVFVFCSCYFRLRLRVSGVIISYIGQQCLTPRIACALLEEGNVLNAEWHR